ncbi:hypothetical protein K440DRAFT_671518 [Wilcoxina mikolae CBS 423.85]|nr:hypothetical protein K440DRAFT_671518 [Wilcoxina mikolae CBS 423.85]
MSREHQAKKFAVFLGILFTTVVKELSFGLNIKNHDRSLKLGFQVLGAVFATLGGYFEAPTTKKWLNGAAIAVPLTQCIFECLSGIPKVYSGQTRRYYIASTSEARFKLLQSNTYVRISILERERYGWLRLNSNFDQQWPEAR